MPYEPEKDPFRLARADEMIRPPCDAVSITPSDSADLPRYVRALTCTGAGNASVIPSGAPDDSNPITIAIAAGQWFPLEVRRVRATGTTATGIVGATVRG